MAQPTRARPKLSKSKALLPTMVRTALIFAALALAYADTRVHQASNPHASEETQCSADGTLDDLLERPFLAPLETQKDTFKGRSLAKTAAGAQVQLFEFTQPARLNPAELPFSVAAVAWPAADPRLLVASDSHDDSWFPGHRWQIVGATNACGSLVHLGWKFTSTTTGESFLALIVRRSVEDAERVFRIGNSATAALAALLLHASAASPRATL